MIGCCGAACGCVGIDVLSGRTRGCSEAACFLLGRHAVIRFKVFLSLANNELEGAMMGWQSLSLPNLNSKCLGKHNGKIDRRGISATIR